MWWILTIAQLTERYYLIPNLRGKHCRFSVRLTFHDVFEYTIFGKSLCFKLSNFVFLEIALDPCQQFCEATEDGINVDIVPLELENGTRCHDNLSSFDVCIQGKCQVLNIMCLCRLC